MTKFIFDLDGTITSQETLPIIAKHFQVEDQIYDLTMETVKGNIPFIEGFIKRVHVLGKLPVDEVSLLLENTGLYEGVHQFIQQNKENCIIATGNLRAWVDRLTDRIDCESYTSDAIVENNQITKITKILRKELIVKELKEQGHKVVFIGDGNNDMEAMRIADVAIATGLTHYPAKSIIPISDYLIFNEQALCRQLNQLL